MDKFINKEQKAVDSEEKGIAERQEYEVNDSVIQAGRIRLSNLEQYLTDNELEDDREDGRVFLTFLEPLDLSDATETQILTRLYAYLGDKSFLNNDTTFNNMAFILQTALENPTVGTRQADKDDLRRLFLYLARNNIYVNVVRYRIWSFSDLNIRKYIADTVVKIQKQYVSELQYPPGLEPLSEQTLAWIVGTAGNLVATDAVELGIISKTAMLQLIRQTHKTIAVQRLTSDEDAENILAMLKTDVSKPVAESFGRYVRSFPADFQVNFYTTLQTVYDRHTNRDAADTEFNNYVLLVSKGLLSPSALYGIFRGVSNGLYLLNNTLVTLVLSGVLDKDFYRTLALVFRVVPPETPEERSVLMNLDINVVKTGFITNFINNPGLLTNAQKRMYSPDATENKTEIQNAVLQGRPVTVVNVTSMSDYRERRQRKRKGYRDEPPLEAESKSNTQLRAHPSVDTQKLLKATTPEDEITKMFYYFFC